MKYLVIIVIALAVIGAIAFSVKSSQKIAPQSPEQSTVAEEQKRPRSLTELLAMGQTQECSYVFDGDEGKVEGTIHVSGQKLAGNFKMTGTSAEPVTGNIINDGMYTYLWTSAMPQGIKMKQVEGEQGEKKTDADRYLGSEKNVDYSCRGWTTDPAAFIPPSSIEFTDLSEQMEQFQTQQDSMMQQDTTTGQNDASAQPSCEICDQIEDPDAKSSCLQSLGC